jgi:dTDP-4-amino-4,6-dideoxygalactose transaminase
MDGLQAAILTAKLPYILSWTKERRRCANTYLKLLNGNKFVKCPLIRDNSEHSFHLFIIQVEKRDELQIFLKEKGIETVIHYPKALVNLKCYEYLNLNSANYPNVTFIQSRILSLPIYPELTDEMIEFVVEKINEFYS